jgi:hypothetical protein
MRSLSLLLATLLLTLTFANCGSAAGNDPFKTTAAFTPPSITTLSPNAVPVNSVAFTLGVTGANFGTDAIVFWHGTPRFTRFVSSTELLVNVTETDLSYFGQVPIYVRTQGQNSNTVEFSVTIQ